MQKNYDINNKQTIYKQFPWDTNFREFWLILRKIKKLKITTHSRKYLIGLIFASQIFAWIYFRDLKKFQRKKN